MSIPLYELEIGEYFLYKGKRYKKGNIRTMTAWKRHSYVKITDYFVCGHMGKTYQIHKDELVDREVWDE